MLRRAAKSETLVSSARFHGMLAHRELRVSMLVRAVLLLSCLVCATVRAQATPTLTPMPAPSAGRVGDSAVPVDRQALISPTDLPKGHHDIESDPLFVPGAVLVGTGAVALLTSLLTGLGANSLYSSLERECKNDVCSGKQQNRIDSGKTLAVVSTVLTGIGVGAAGVGTVLLIIAASREDQAPPSLFGIAGVRLTGGPSPLGIGASASF
jgi:hypothetical protein